MGEEGVAIARLHNLRFLKLAVSILFPPPPNNQANCPTENRNQMEYIFQFIPFAFLFLGFPGYIIALGFRRLVYFRHRLSRLIWLQNIFRSLVMRRRPISWNRSRRMFIFPDSCWKNKWREALPTQVSSRPTEVYKMSFKTHKIWSVRMGAATVWKQWPLLWHEKDLLFY